MSALLCLVLAAAPLQVRVLERETPARVHLEAARFTCDGQPLPGTTFDAEASIREVKVGDAKCTQLVGEDGVTVSVKSTTRKYEGQVRVSLEGGLLRLINVVDRKNFRTTIDIGNFLCADEDPVAATKNM